MAEKLDIPMDVYDSDQELVVIIPLGGVLKDSIEIYLEKTTLNIKANRKQPDLKETLQPVQQDCYWGEFSKSIQLPQNVYFDKIYTQLTKENILIITVPKVIIPEKVKIEVDSFT
ncbi:Hsp20/alpha crystallin family protein [Candidatus Absconditicoccus praedator]|uniref:Hsp20/alpha crystallin family protein n=1 Tax=Candidatus Absconditicoccus praedator TaxID=2735562 RepID=UPI001E417206|nr:Hsp20/alpha crystallin family protein [Candidatus Absconditicoccus praedator]UFX82815.1 Hsp20/alpha crystallin family protein [Candidatus Absconditicoccus praedator]